MLVIQIMVDINLGFHQGSRYYCSYRNEKSVDQQLANGFTDPSIENLRDKKHIHVIEIKFGVLKFQICK